jgi:hypothetical protein
MDLDAQNSVLRSQTIKNYAYDKLIPYIGRVILLQKRPCKGYLSQLSIPQIFQQNYRIQVEPTSICQPRA